LFASRRIAMPSLLPNVQITNAQHLESMNIVDSNGDDMERRVFMGDINRFMAEIGKPLSKIPIMGYKELDLFQLFKEVTAYGGFIEVVKNVGTWSKIWKRLGNFDPSITDSSFRLKKNYERYLLDYEYKCFPEHRQQALDLEKQMHLKKSHSSEGLTRSASMDSIKKSPKASHNADPAKANKTKKAKRKVYSASSLRDGMTSPVVAHLIRELPDAETCKADGSWSSSPSSSPSLGRKRRTEESFSEGEESDESYGKKPKKYASDEDYVSEYESHFNTRSFASRKELEDLETAVATLQALKYCAVY